MRDEPLRTSAWEARKPHDSKKCCIICKKKSKKRQSIDKLTFPCKYDCLRSPDSFQEKRLLKFENIMAQNARHVTELICPKFCPDLDRRKVNFGCHRHHRIATRNFILVNLTLGRTRKFIPPPWYKGGGGVVDETPPQSYVAVFRNDFTFSGKPLIFSTR